MAFRRPPDVSNFKLGCLSFISSRCAPRTRRSIASRPPVNGFFGANSHEQESQRSRDSSRCFGEIVQHDRSSCTFCSCRGFPTQPSKSQYVSNVKHHVGRGSSSPLRFPSCDLTSRVNVWILRRHADFVELSPDS